MKKSGYGVFIRENGIEYEGNWVNDKLEGCVFIRFPTGDQVKGN